VPLYKVYGSELYMTIGNLQRFILNSTKNTYLLIKVFWYKTFKTKFFEKQEDNTMAVTNITPMTTVEPSGAVSAANVNEFENQLNNAVSSENNQILLVDMTQVDFLDSAGLMALVKGFRLAQSLGRRFILCSLAPSVKMIFELTQLDRVFEIFDSKDLIESSFVVRI
jgi:anti-sigma B factor antagonist